MRMTFLVDPPIAVAAQTDRFDQLGHALLAAGRWADAFEAFRNELEVFNNGQEPGHRLHKGRALHNMGAARLRAGLAREGLRWTLYGFIEDALSKAEGPSRSRDELYMPAAQMLRLFNLSDAEIRDLADRCRARIASGRLVDDPSEVFVQEGLDRYLTPVPERAVRQTGPVRVFVSSPKDLGQERRMVAEVCRDLRRAGIDVQALMWEGGGRDYAEVEAFPSSVAGLGPQGVIDDHVWGALGGYDIYLGMMWLSAGTPTNGFASGTEAEYRYALDRYRADHYPSDLYFYQKRARAPSIAEPGVETLVTDLRKQGLVFKFSTSKALRRKIFDDLSTAAKAARP
jgi:hypothetical protein